MEKRTEYRTIGLETLHQESRKWLSQIEFAADENTFFRNLLQSYVFEPDTPDLFEDLQMHQKGLDDARDKCNALKRQVVEHENQLSGLMQLDNHTLDAAYQDKHKYLKEDMEECMAGFQKLKLDMFRYGQTILKKRHKKDQ